MTPARAEYRVRARLWLYPGKGGWYFVTVPRAQSRKIKALFGPEARGWGSIPIRVRIGKTEWRTSLFPDRKTGNYLFAVKAEVRKKQRVDAGDTITATVEVP